jgi:hypothetical protein
MRLFTEGLKFYKEALLKQFGIMKESPNTGKRENYLEKELNKAK